MAETPEHRTKEMLRSMSAGTLHVRLLFRHAPGYSRLNLETPETFDAGAATVRTEKKRLVADLANVEAYILGVDNAGEPIAYWDRLREYWHEYFTKAGVHVERYSVLWEFRGIEP